MFTNKIWYRLPVFTLTLLLLRVWHTEGLAYLFLLWNLFLAWLPLYFMMKYKNINNRKLQFVLLCLVILFLPNAPYLITDLFHLGKQREAPLWLDTLLLSSFAILGCVLFVRTLVLFFSAVQQFTNSKQLLMPMKISVMLLNGYGIYLGRYLRFNSWDIVTHPVRLFRAIVESMQYNSHLKETLLITISFAVFLFLIYEMASEKQFNETLTEK